MSKENYYTWHLSLRVDRPVEVRANKCWLSELLPIRFDRFEIGPLALG